MFAIFSEPMYYSWGNSALVNQHFSWNIPESLSLAELWMGSHPRAPSRVLKPGTNFPEDDQNTLLNLIQKYPDLMLGKDWQSPDGNPSLPFLFKVLSASQALSIQAHPSLEQAQEGFIRENRAGIPLHAAHRNYKDSNHKPESITALGDFYAMRGFRSPQVILEFFQPVGERARGFLDALTIGQDGKALASFVEKLFRFDQRDLTHLLKAIEHIAHSKLEGLSYQSEEYLISPYRWFLKLLRDFPGDPGTLSPFYLEIFHLKPGQSMILKAGELHAYLEGIGIELMANSDNVLRAGCTSKHIDLEELLNVTHFCVNREGVIEAKENQWLDGGNKEFKLFWGAMNGSQEQRLATSARPRIFLCLTNPLTLTYDPGDETKEFDSLAHEPHFIRAITLTAGKSVFIPPRSPSIRIQGSGTFALAAVGQDG